MEYQKRFSIVIPVYNVENYIDICIQSIINQTLSFEKYVELVLVNDGSKDESGQICRKYLEAYPNNVVYIEQKNAGVSEARNRGVEAATGEIIGFLDSDDKLSESTLACVSRYFDIVLDTVDVAVIPVKNFGARTFPYYLKGKFENGTRTLSLSDPNWDDVCMRVGQAFVRSEVAKRHLFDKTLTYFEDAKYINEIIKEKMRMGVVTGCEYYYRRYPSEADSATSLTIGAETNKRLYIETPEKLSLYFLEQYKDEDDTPLYFQYLALCEMRWRIFYTNIQTVNILSTDEFKKYEEINDRILKHVSDYAILTFSHYQPWQKLYLLNMKHKTNLLETLQTNEENHIVWRDFIIDDLNKTIFLLLDLDINDNNLILKGFVNSLINDSITCHACINSKDVMLSLCEDQIPASQFPLDYKAYGFPTFSLRVSLSDEPTTISFLLHTTCASCEIASIKPSSKGNTENTKPEVQIRNGYFIHRKKANIQVYKATIASKIKWYIQKSLCKFKQFIKKIKNSILRCIFSTAGKILRKIKATIAPLHNTEKNQVND